jgi:hypothetical protein
VASPQAVPFPKNLNQSGLQYLIVKIFTALGAHHALEVHGTAGPHGGRI